MGNDEFASQAGKAFQNVAVGAAGLVGGLPGVALAAGVAGAFNVFEALVAGRTDAFNEARLGALEDEVRKVADEVRKIQEARTAEGKPFDSPDPLTQGVLFSQFANDVANSATPEKRTALVHATARQFDPELGSAAVRHYWLGLVRDLNDVEIFAIRTLARADRLTFPAQKAQSPSAVEGAFLVMPLTDDEHAALHETVRRLAELSGFVTETPQTARRAPVYMLSRSGRILARYIDDSPDHDAKDAG